MLIHQNTNGKLIKTAKNSSALDFSSGHPFGQPSLDQSVNSINSKVRSENQQIIYNVAGKPEEAHHRVKESYKTENNGTQHAQSQ
jgi:hypothetical protein